MSYFDDASLVMIPSGYKEDKVYSVKPIDGSGDLDFTRASSATRIGPTGLIEKTRTNLLLQSNQFDTTWVNSNTSETSGQTGYDGTNNAWLLDKSAASGYIQQLISLGDIQTFSVYAKKGTLNWVRIIAVGSSTASTWFDLENGVVGSADFFTVDSNIQSVGNGWYRCSITYSVGTIGGVRIYPSQDNNNVSGTSGNIYIQSAQLEQGLVATSYIDTTSTTVTVGSYDNVPRLNYTAGSTSSCPSLLLEPQRTNVYVQSEYFSGGDWDLNAGTTLTNNYAISPEGVQNATRYLGVGTSGLGDKYTLVNGTQYTTSAYVKSNTSATQYCRLFGDSSNVSSDLEVTTEWTRIDFTWTSGGLTNKANGITRDSSDNDIDILIFAFQLEAGSYESSYIPTYGATVTRVADACNKPTVSSLIGQEQGTFFVEWESIGNTAEPYFALSAGGSTGNRVLIYVASSGVNSQVKSGSSTVFQSTAASVSGTIKAAVAYNTNDFVFYVNGTQYGTDTSGATFSGTTLSEIEFDHANLTGSSIKKSVLFKTRLSNTQLAELTS